MRDIWAHVDLPLIAKGAGVVRAKVQPLDSVFVRLSPSRLVETITAGLAHQHLA